jgi:hypothetical protein
MSDITSTFDIEMIDDTALETTATSRKIVNKIKTKDLYTVARESEYRFDPL